MNKPSTLRIVTIVVPLVCLLLAIFLVVSQTRRLHAQEDKRAQLTQQITSLDLLAREMQARPPLSKMAAASPTPDEQPLFLNLIRGFANASLVNLVKYENKTVPPPAPDSAEAKANALPPGVIALTSAVEVAGGYNQVRQFMNELWRSPRLFNTTDLKWIATQDKWPDTRLSFTLTRYVHTAAYAGSPAAAPPGAAAQPGVGAPAGTGAAPGGTSVLPGGDAATRGAPAPRAATGIRIGPAAGVTPVPPARP